MVIFDRIGRDSDCSFINSSSEKNSIQIGEAPLAKLTEIHSPCLVREDSFKNQNAFLQRTKPNWHPLTWYSNTNLHFCRCSSWLADTSLWMFCTTHSHDHAMRSKMDFFQCDPTTKSSWCTVLQSWRWCREPMGRKMAGITPTCPKKMGSKQMKMVVSRGCLHRRRTWNRKSKLIFIIKCQFDSTSEVFLVHHDHKTIRYLCVCF